MKKMRATWIFAKEDQLIFMFSTNIKGVRLPWKQIYAPINQKSVANGQAVTELS